MLYGYTLLGLYHLLPFCVFLYFLRCQATIFNILYLYVHFLLYHHSPHPLFFLILYIHFRCKTIVRIVFICAFKLYCYFYFLTLVSFVLTSIYIIYVHSFLYHLYKELLCHLYLFTPLLLVSIRSCITCIYLFLYHLYLNLMYH